MHEIVHREDVKANQYSDNLTSYLTIDKSSRVRTKDVAVQTELDTLTKYFLEQPES